MALAITCVIAVVCKVGVIVVMKVVVELKQDVAMVKLFNPIEMMDICATLDALPSCDLVATLASFSALLFTHTITPPRVVATNKTELKR